MQRSTIEQPGVIFRPTIWDLERGCIVDVFASDNTSAHYAPGDKSKIQKGNIELILNNPRQILIRCTSGLLEWVKLNQIYKMYC